jgi:hypothetical protein
MPTIPCSKAQPEYDVEIVGSGAGGGQMAHTLTLAGLKCVMLEAGRSYDPIGETPMFQRSDQAPLEGVSTPDKDLGFWDSTVDGGWQVPGEPYTQGSTKPEEQFTSWRAHESLGAAFRCATDLTISSPAATITPAAPRHPIASGWKEFTLRDEPYTNNYFSKEDNKAAPNITVLATSMLPPNAPKSERVSWCIERADGGRGFGIVMPHFYRNWTDEDLRRFILNGIVWSAKLEVPDGGVKTTLPDLKESKPVSMDFVPRSPNVKALNPR